MRIIHELRAERRNPRYCVEARPVSTRIELGWIYQAGEFDSERKALREAKRWARNGFDVRVINRGADHG